jgi:hypothetical protein
MEVVDTAQINSFAPIAAQTNFVQPSEEAVFILTSGQLSALITKAIEKVIQPLVERVESLENTIARQDEKIAALQATQDTHADNQLIQLRLINDLRDATRKEPQLRQKDRGEILRALLAANGGKMLAKDARQKMHLSKNRFSELLKICDFIETKPLHSDRRKYIIILKSELVPRN